MSLLFGHLVTCTDLKQHLVAEAWGSCKANKYRCALIKLRRASQQLWPFTPWPLLAIKSHVLTEAERLGKSDRRKPRHQTAARQAPIRHAIRRRCRTAATVQPSRVNIAKNVFLLRTMACGARLALTIIFACRRAARWGMHDMLNIWYSYNRAKPRNQ